MPKAKIFVNLIFFFIVASNSGRCLNSQGESVDWWVKLIFPKNVPSGFAYFDNTFEAPSFVVFQQLADDQDSPLSLTLNQANQLNMDVIAWNDQPPNIKSTSTKAHSKGILSFNQQNGQSFIISHSLPKFPSIQNSSVSSVINPSQKVYGQHALCISLDQQKFESILVKLLPMRPSIYAQIFRGNYSINQIIVNGDNQPDYESSFTYISDTLNENNMKFIFKNGGINASIFEDGLNHMLESSLYAETWGRPLQQSWCGDQMSVNNIKKVQICDTIYWNQSQDHSKWVYADANDYACFGDMNRMSSQWKRGGAFYCIQSANLKSALEAITKSIQLCQNQ